MKKLNKTQLRNAVLLEDREMKLINGGSGSSDCSTNRCGTKLCCDLQWNHCVNGYCQSRP